MPSIRRLTTLVRAPRASSGRSSIIGAIVAVGILRTGRSGGLCLRGGRAGYRAIQVEMHGRRRDGERAKRPKEYELRVVNRP